VEVTLEVTGVAEALKTLRKADPELRKAVIKDMKAAAKPLETQARSLIPARPLRNWYSWPRGEGDWNQSRAQKGIKVAVRTGGVKGKSGDHFPLLSLRQTDAQGAIFEIAGRSYPSKRSEGEARGDNMVNKLNMFGQASRTLWPTAEKGMPEVERALLLSIDRLSAAINEMLEKGAR
jgi:hypothetical protein